MSVEMLVRGAIEAQMTDLAGRVLKDFKAVVGKHNRTGEAQASISILEQSPQRIVVGGRNDHLYWLDEGNNHSGAIIYARGKALGKWKDGIPGIGWRASVKAYDGFHVAREVANKYR